MSRSKKFLNEMFSSSMKNFNLSEDLSYSPSVKRAKLLEDFAIKALGLYEDEKELLADKTPSKEEAASLQRARELNRYLWEKLEEENNFITYYRG